MSHRWSLFIGFTVLVSLLTVSCSQPGQDLQGSKPSQSATVETINKGVEPAPEATPRPADEPKPVEEVKKKPAEPARRAAAAPAPVQTAPAAAAPQPAPAPAPVPQSASVTAPAPIVVPAPQSDPIPVPSPPAPAEPTTKTVTIPAGTEVYIRMIDSINAEKSHPNETFRASLDKPLVINNETIIPRRSDVYVKVIEVQTAGKLKGQSELQVQLDRIFIGKQSYNVASNTFTKTGDSEGKKAARNVGIGAAVGAALGGILGGGKGAVIGAGAGGGGGAVITKPDQLQIDSETQLLFKLENPLDVTITQAPPKPVSSTSAFGSDGPARLAPPPDRPSAQTSSRPAATDQNDLTGEWTVTTDGAQYMTLQLSLRQNGRNLQGSISNPQGPGTLPIRGSVSGNYITFSTQPQYGGGGYNNAPLQFSGAIDNDNLQGTVILPSNANNGGGGYPTGYPGYPGGRRTGRTGGGTIQVHWTARRSD